MHSSAVRVVLVLLVLCLGAGPVVAQERATIRYALPDPQEADLRLYDVIGRHVKTLAQGEQVGRHALQLDVSDLASGTYFLRLNTEEATPTQRVTVLR